MRPTRKIIRANPTALAPLVKPQRNTSGNSPTSSGPSSSTQVPTNNPTASVPQTSLVPNKTHMYTPGGWKILSEPTTYSQYPGVLFLEFQDPSYANLMQPKGMKDLAKLNLEINTLLRQPNKKIVLELPPVWLSTEISSVLSAMKRSLKSPNILVLLSGSPHPQANFLVAWGFHISSDIHHAAQIAQAGRMVPLLSAPAVPFIPSPPAGLWQILNKPAVDPAHPDIYFLELQNQNSVQLTNTQDLNTLSDELNTLTNNPGQKIVFELPPTRLSQEIIILLIGNCIATEEDSGKFIFYFQSRSTKSQALEELGFDVAKNKADAVALTQAQPATQNTGSVLNGVKFYPPSNSIIPLPKCGYWQVLQEPICDPKYQGVYFANFQLPDYVKMTSRQDIETLAEELNAVFDDPARSAVINLPDLPPMSKEVTKTLLATDVFSRTYGGKVVYLFPYLTPQAQALQELAFEVFCDRDLAANAALSSTSPLLFLQSGSNPNATSGGTPNSSGPAVVYP